MTSAPRPARAGSPPEQPPLLLGLQLEQLGAGPFQLDGQLGGPLLGLGALAQGVSTMIDFGDARPAKAKPASRPAAKPAPKPAPKPAKR